MPIVIPTLVKIALGALGTAAVIHWVAREVRRINDELERVRAASTIDPRQLQALPTLRQDPRTGDWRVM